MTVSSSSSSNPLSSRTEEFLCGWPHLAGKFANIPSTTAVDAEKAMRTLDYEEMCALAVMYERWAFSEEHITSEQRTQLIIWSADYERIAAHVGAGWSAPDPRPDDPIAYVAQLELRRTR